MITVTATVITVIGDSDHAVAITAITGRGWWRDAHVRERAHARGEGEVAAGAGEVMRGGCPLCADDPGENRK